MTSSFVKANNGPLNEKKAIPYCKELTFNESLPKHAHRAMELMGSSSHLHILCNSLNLTAFSVTIQPELCLGIIFPLFYLFPPTTTVPFLIWLEDSLLDR